MKLIEEVLHKLDKISLSKIKTLRLPVKKIFFCFCNFEKWK
jgi:hypothetical protein